MPVSERSGWKGRYGLIVAVTFMRTSPEPGSGIARVPSVTGLSSSVTKSAFCILRVTL